MHIVQAKNFKAGTADLPDPFRTRAELEAYFDDDKLACLICGKRFANLGLHVSATHKISGDAYRERFGIPWTYGLAGKAFREKSARRFRELREEGRLALAPSEEHIKTLREAASKKRRKIVPAFSNDSRIKVLALHGRTEKWGVDDLEEYLRRIGQGRTPVEVSRDPDMPCAKVFYKNVRENADYQKRYQKIWDTLPYKVHVRAGKPSRKYEREVVRLRREGLTWQEVAHKLDVGVSAVRGTWHRLKKQGRL
jgi:hypothetical protein